MGAGALDGVSVLDFTRVVSGPVASQILGDLGADVVKVERVEGGDESRMYGLTGEMPAPGPTFVAQNRNKRSIAVDLKSAAGIEVIRALARSVDVVIHNFRPGVMEGLCLGYEDLAPLNERLVYCSISGFGARGPLARRAANDLSIQAYSGLLSITGERGGGPVRNPTPVCDITAGLFAAIGMIAALHSRSTTGRGQQVSTSMLEGQLTMLNQFIVNYWLTGEIPQRMGTANTLGLPNECFPTSDGWVAITSPNESVWRRCCAALGISELAEDPRFRTLRDRYEHREEVVAAVSEATSRFTTADCLQRLETAGVPSAPIHTIQQIAEDPVLDALGATAEMALTEGRRIRVLPTPLSFSATPVEARRPPPALGEHTDEILRSIGYSQPDIDQLRATKAIA